MLCRHHNIEGFGFPDRRQIPSMCQEAPGKRQEAAEKPKSTDDLLAIVRERYARGEINKEEFTTLSKDLAGQGP